MMTRKQIINKLKNYFEIYELVGEAVYKKHGENAWFVFETNILECLLIIREGIGEPITINDWHWGGSFDERGYRSNIQEIVKGKTDKGILYTSGHPLGCAFDMVWKRIIAEDVRDWIKDNEDLFPCKIRLEHKKKGVPITWMHIDNLDFDKNPKVYLFNV